MTVFESIQKRKSIRAYLDKPVSDSDLEKIIEAGRWAPNAGTFQISVIRKKTLRQKINDCTLDAMIHSGIEFLQQRASLPGYQPLYGAPVLILLSAPKDAPHSSINTALAAENMLLAATELGLGSCFLVSPTLALNGTNNQELVLETGMAESFKLQCAIIVGYAASENKFTGVERNPKGFVNYIV